METVETEELRKYCVYLITNLVNGKQYCGKTGSTVSVRWNEHKRHSKGKEDTAFIRAIRKYGEGSFRVCTLREGLTKEQANKEERLTIKTLNLLCKQFGYNMTEGGDGPARYVHLPIKEIAKRYQKGESADNMAKQYGCDPKTVLRQLRTEGIKIRSAREGIKLSSSKMSQNSFNRRHDVSSHLLSKLYTEGWNSRQLAEQFNMDKSTVLERLRKFGVKRRIGGLQHTRDRRFEDESERIAYIQQIRSEAEEIR